MNNKPTGLRLVSVCLALPLVLGLEGCASAPAPAPDAAPVVEPPPVPRDTVRPAVQPEQPVVVRPDHPHRYVVVKGDTLWDIAARFLKDPWTWPEVWHVNRAVANPHLIYPGDVLVLYYVDGKPVLKVQQADEAPRGLETVRLTPQARVEGLDRAIPTIPMDAIRPFLSKPRVVGARELEAAPYIVSSFEEHLISGTGDRVYARGVRDEDVVAYSVYRKGQAYRSPDRRGILGYEAVHVADAKLLRPGDPATLQLAKARQETLTGDRLLPAEPEGVAVNFMPRVPADPVTGHVIAVMNGVSEIGQFDVVVLDRGREDGLEPGHVLAVHQAGPRVRDAVAGGRVTLPDERAGVVMVFRTFDRVSYALVMRAERALHVLDKVRNP